MRVAVKFMGVVVATAVLGVTLFPMRPLDAASGEEVIKARLKLMQDEINGHWKVLAAYAKNGKGSLSDVENHARALVKSAEEIPIHFPKDTGRGNYPDKVTRALPAIWKDWEGFKKAAQGLADGSEKLERAAREGNKDAVVTLIGTSGRYSKTKIGCAECHEKFQGPKVKN